MSNLKEIFAWNVAVWILLGVEEVTGKFQFLVAAMICAVAAMICAAIAIVLSVERKG